MTTVLFVSPVEVNRPVDGLRWRAHLTARGLAQLGDVQVVEATTDSDRSGPLVAVTPRTPIRRAGSRFHPARPQRVASRDWSPAGRVLDGFEEVDLIWVMQPDLIGSGLTLPEGPLVVDMVDLEDGKYVGAGWLTRHQRRRWLALEQVVVDRAEAIVLAHPGEAATLDHPRVVAVPNAVDVDPVEVDDDGRTLTLVGRYTYQPNQEAAEWMVQDVLPLIHAQHPDVRLRLVGRHDGLLQGLAAVEGVDVTGFVPDLTGVWQATTATVAPIRSGTGTRLKIIEAFARGVPVVSTTHGCDGIDVTPRDQLLVADDADAFAAACIEILEDDGLRRRLRSSALEYVNRAHAPDAVASLVAEVGRAAMETR